MTILQGDIKLLASQVMDDVATGGGAATGNVIVDGSSNSIFADISELDRTTGRVALSKIFAAIQTLSTDTYYGTHIIIAKPPADPNVSATLFSTGDFFDRRSDAKNRVEQYLAMSSKFQGLLFENHYQGQRAIQLITREGVALPKVGETLVLVGSASTQYVRVTSASATARTFSYQNGSTAVDFKRQIITCEISDALRSDFAGSSASPVDAVATGAAQVLTTVVADAARYYGCAKLAEAVALGQRTAKVSSIYTQLVPSAQTDIPVADAAPLSSVAALNASASGTVSVTTSAALSPTASMYIGSGIMPGSLSVVSGTVTFTDSGGELRANGISVGTVDYVNGVLAIAQGGATYSGTKSVTYRPASAPLSPSATMALDVTAANRAASYVFTLDPLPAPGTVVIAYMALGNWYELRDQGNGNVKGTDAAYGSGNLSTSTGALTVTFGSLPDVGSTILVSYGVSATKFGLPATQAAKLALEFNLGFAVAKGSLAVTWPGAAAPVKDDGSTSAAGTVDVAYDTGYVKVAPASLPAPGTVFAFTYNKPDASTGPAPTVQELTPSGSDATNWRGSFGGAVQAGTVSITVPYYVKKTTQALTTEDVQQDYTLRDKNGSLYILAGTTLGTIAVGTIDYTTGAVTILRSTPALACPVENAIWVRRELPHYDDQENYAFEYVGTRVDYVSGAVSGSEVLQVSFVAGTGAPSAQNISLSATTAVALVDFGIRSGTLSNGSLRMEGAALGGTVYDSLSNNDLLLNLNNSTGAGSVIGSVDRAARRIVVTAWQTGAAVDVSIVSALALSSDYYMTHIEFRAPVAPIRPGAFTIAAYKGSGERIVATADGNGAISTADMTGSINYQTGVGRLTFKEGARTVTYPTYAAGVGQGYNGYQGANPTGSSSASTTAASVDARTITINCTGYSYLPIDAAIIGLDPVRLPQDGRVPIFRKGDIAVVHHTKSTASINVSNNQTIDLARERIARVRVVGSDGIGILSGYTTDLDNGTIKFTDITGYHQPVRIEDTIEDRVMVSDVQINGQLSFTRQLTHDFPLGSYVSSALVASPQDLKARVPVLFDQVTWSNVWSDTLIGSDATATYNSIQYPIEVQNKGAVTERWLIQFTNTNTFNVIGEHVGLIATGNTSTDCAPVNPATNTPYFTIRAAGWGGGWSAGNCLRINTQGALQPVWSARTVQQGAATALDDSFTILISGDIDRV